MHYVPSLTWKIVALCYANSKAQCNVILEIPIEFYIIFKGYSSSFILKIKLIHYNLIVSFPEFHTLDLLHISMICHDRLVSINNI